MREAAVSHAKVLPVAGLAMNLKTKESTEWRAKQRALGRVPKLIWIDPLDWPRLQGLIELLKRNRARKQPKD